MPYALLLAVIFFSGMTIIGSQTGANATCGALYPARMRTSGLGWALGIGRLGGIAAPVLGGYLLARRPGADPHLSERLPVCDYRRGRDRPVGLVRLPPRARRQPRPLPDPRLTRRGGTAANSR